MRMEAFGNGEFEVWKDITTGNQDYIRITFSCEKLAVLNDYFDIVNFALPGGGLFPGLRFIDSRDIPQFKPLSLDRTSRGHTKSWGITPLASFSAARKV